MNQGEMIEETHDKVTRIEAVLLGIPGTKDGGLVAQVNGIAASHYKLKRNFYVLVGLLIGSTVIGAGIWRMVEWLGV